MFYGKFLHRGERGVLLDFFFFWLFVTGNFGGGGGLTFSPTRSGAGLVYVLWVEWGGGGV